VSPATLPASARFLEPKRDLLFDILTRLRKEGITLSTPQTMVIERRQPVVTTKPDDELLPYAG
jgi:hypothetical protein